MDPIRRRFGLGVLLGGAAVPISYLVELGRHPETRQLLWGDVPQIAIPYYTGNMFLAALGYFFFTSYIWFNVPSEGAHIGGRPALSVFGQAYALVLIGSALWMPLSFLALDSGNEGWVPLVFIDLALVAIGSLTIVLGLWKLTPRKAERWRKLALLGCIPFCVQTILLDAIIWPLHFSLP